MKNWQRYIIPDIGVKSPLLPRVEAKKGEPPVDCRYHKLNYDLTEITETVFRETSLENEKIRFGIKQDDRRRHMYVVGSTGMGKSEFLKSMAIQDIEAGRGVCFIDPHGDSADDLLDYIPEERIKDVIYFDPDDLQYPIAFNVMEGIGFDYRHLVASGLVGVFKKIWGAEAWSGRMEYILNNTILALLEYPGSTLLGINRLMSGKEYRKKLSPM